MARKTGRPRKQKTSEQLKSEIRKRLSRGRAGQAAAVRSDQHNASRNYRAYVKNNPNRKTYFKTAADNPNISTKKLNADLQKKFGNNLKFKQTGILTEQTYTGKHQAANSAVNTKTGNRSVGANQGAYKRNVAVTNTNVRGEGGTTAGWAELRQASRLNSKQTQKLQQELGALRQLRNSGKISQAEFERRGNELSDKYVGMGAQSVS